MLGRGISAVLILARQSRADNYEDYGRRNRFSDAAINAGYGVEQFHTRPALSAIRIKS
jgi:hypothetical protein